MTTYEIRDPDEARRYLLQGLLLSRAAPLTPSRVIDALEWSMEVLSDGSPLPPVGFVADVGHVAMEADRSLDSKQLANVEGLDPSLSRRYEDYVIGKLFADMSFERASDALARYQGRDRNRGLAYIIQQQRVRCEFGGVILAPAVIKGLLSQKPEQILKQAWDSVRDVGIDAQLLEDFENLIAAVRNTGELLGPEDIFELESGTALADFGQRLALRQVLQMSAELKQELPKQKPRSQPRRYSVATNIMEEDHYPIGGFTSISNRGTIESLVRSELAYIDDDIRPDLFDIKFARNELLYYSRDENQFLRRRLSFVFVLHLDLVDARMKDSELPCQRIILLLASLYVCANQLLEWLSNDAIRFEFLMVEADGALQRDERSLSDEHTLIETLFREETAMSTAEIRSIERSQVESHCTELGRTSMCHTLAIGCKDVSYTDDFSIASVLQLDAETPTILFPDDTIQSSEEPGVDGWKEQLERLLRFWV